MLNLEGKLSGSQDCVLVSRKIPAIEGAEGATACMNGQRDGSGVAKRLCRNRWNRKMA